MRGAFMAAALLAACVSPVAPGEPQHELTLTPYLFTARSGETVEAELGRFSVLENRANPRSRRIELSFVRFPSTAAHPGNPIVYLSGGPGAAATETARNWRFDIFMALVWLTLSARRQPQFWAMR